MVTTDDGSFYSSRDLLRSQRRRLVRLRPPGSQALDFALEPSGFEVLHFLQRLEALGDGFELALNLEELVLGADFLQPGGFERRATILERQELGDRGVGENRGAILFRLLTGSNTSEQPGRGVVVPALPGANVASRNPLAAPAPVPHNAGLGLAGAGRRGGQARAQRVPTEIALEADFFGATLHNLADRRRRERQPEVAVPIDPPEDAPLDDLGALKPALQGAERTGRLIESKGNGDFDPDAFLIALRAP